MIHIAGQGRGAVCKQMAVVVRRKAARCGTGCQLKEQRVGNSDGMAVHHLRQPLQSG